MKLFDGCSPLFQNFRFPPLTLSALPWTRLYIPCKPSNPVFAAPPKNPATLTLLTQSPSIPSSLMQTQRSNFLPPPRLPPPQLRSLSTWRRRRRRRKEPSLTSLRRRHHRIQCMCAWETSVETLEFWWVWIVAARARRRRLLFRWECRLRPLFLRFGEFLLSSLGLILMAF